MRFRSYRCGEKGVPRSSAFARFSASVRAGTSPWFKRTADSLHVFLIAPNLLDQDFTVTAANQKWSSDISYVWTRGARMR